MEAVAALVVVDYLIIAVRVHQFGVDGVTPVSNASGPWHRRNCRPTTRLGHIFIVLVVNYLVHLVRGLSLDHCFVKLI